MTRPIVLLLTFVTGFTGLTYEVTWQKYLAILLGAHSEATAAVLGLFLGGLSLGYWIFGAVTRRLVARGTRLGRPAPLLIVYGAVEAGIGLYCVLFPATFAGVRALSLFLPTGTAGFGFTVDVLLAALLVLPPAILMGGTIPILTQALARSLEDATRLHAFVYAFNTAGAFAGALAAGFVLIHWLGLDGVMLYMGVVNLAVGAVLAGLGLRRREIVDLQEPSPEPAERSAEPVVYGVVALLIGFAMMVFQTVLIRVSGLSFGSSEYTFSMVVAVFVLCIALGSAAVSMLPRIGRWLLPSVVWVLAALMAILYPALEKAPYGPHLLRTLFRDQDAGFFAYWVASFAGLALVIGPAVVLSGSTLPLLFHALKREHGDLGARAGRLYSLNTVGSLAGALLGGYAFLFWLDLHHVYRIGIAVLVLAACLTTLLRFPRLGFMPSAAMLLVPLIGIALLAPWEPAWMSAGLFRHRQPTPFTYDGPSAMDLGDAEISFYDDDPNSTVMVQDWWQGAIMSRSIVVNGKSDGNTRGDFDTMALAALLPALFAERAENSFVIGFGTGITAGELAELEEAEQVTVAEISGAVIEAAPLFDFANHGASNHPKIDIVRSDAYRALLKGNRDYDVIVSEPSNPWVTGVEMLFSREFLEDAKQHLSPRGVYAQWFHLYETDAEVVELVIATYASVFDHVAVWSIRNADLILLGFRDAELATDLERIEARLQRPDFQALLGRMEIDSVDALLAHETIPLGVVSAAFFEGPVHSLYRPILSSLAGRAFFVGNSGSLPFLSYGRLAHIGARESLLRRWVEQQDGSRAQIVYQIVQRTCEAELPSCPILLAQWTRANPGEPVPFRETRRTRPFVNAARQLQPLLVPVSEQPRTPIGIQRALEMTRLYLRTTTPAHPIDPSPLVGFWERCGFDDETRAQCAHGLELARRLVRGESVPPPNSPEWLGLQDAPESPNPRRQTPEEEQSD